MNYNVTPNFSNKLNTLKPFSFERLSVFIKQIETSLEESILEELSVFSVRSLEEGIYVAAAGTARVFFTFGEDNGSKYVLLLDILEYEPRPSTQALTARKNPITDSRLNPSVNSRINPYVNSRLNPFVNSLLNPYVNSRLNPLVNSQLNPLVNSRLNPLVNSRINPLVNSRLNPLVNSNINTIFAKNFY